jgi:hypothetical protein
MSSEAPTQTAETNLSAALRDHESLPHAALVPTMLSMARPTRPRRKPRLPRAPLPRQTGGAHEDKSKRPIRKQKYRRPPSVDD